MMRPSITIALVGLLAGFCPAYAMDLPACFLNTDPQYEELINKGIVYRGIGTNAYDNRVTALLRNSDGSLWFVVNQGPLDFCILSYGTDWSEYDAEHKQTELPK